jgi:hypothetical protein
MENIIGSSSILKMVGINGLIFDTAVTWEARGSGEAERDQWVPSSSSSII